MKCLLDIVGSVVGGLYALPSGWQTVKWVCPVSGLCYVVDVVLASVWRPADCPARRQNVVRYTRRTFAVHTDITRCRLTDSVASLHVTSLELSSITTDSVASLLTQQHHYWLGCITTDWLGSITTDAAASLPTQQHHYWLGSITTDSTAHYWLSSITTCYFTGTEQAVIWS